MRPFAYCDLFPIIVFAKKVFKQYIKGLDTSLSIRPFYIFAQSNALGFLNYYDFVRLINRHQTLYLNRPCFRSGTTFQYLPKNNYACRDRQCYDH